METEIEAKFLDINPVAMRLKLKQLGAVQKYPEVLMRRKTFKDNAQNFKKRGEWIRVRDEGEKITMSYKRVDDRTLHGTKEITVVVDDFGRACDFLVASGMKIMSYQETKREAWNYDDVEITIDTWPWIPPFLEIEGSTESSVRKTAADLGFDWNIAMHGSVEPVYQMHYDVTEEEIDNWESITFAPVPKWLEIKRKNFLK